MNNIHQKLIKHIYPKYMINVTWDRPRQVERNVQGASCIILTSARNYCGVSSDTVSKVYSHRLRMRKGFIDYSNGKH